MKFVNHTEGYIEPDGGGGYDYVYQYKDIWGNTRLTYSDDNGDGLVDVSEIRREQNYYPYGLEHRGYNSIASGVKNNLKTYQGQEFTEDLGLNTHEWKYRISDPTIGRFWQIDPLAEDYTYNSTYAFQENKMGMGMGVEGLELAVWSAAKASRDPENSKFVRENPELAAAIWVGFLATPAILAVGPEAAGVFLLNEVKDEALSQATGGVSDIFDLTKNIKNLVKLGIKKLDIGGGLNSKYSDALNIDPNAESGFKGELRDFIEQTGGEIKFSDITVDNPRFDFLNDASKILEDGGTITVRGTMSNKFFNKIVNGKADGLDGFNVSNPVKISNEGFKTTEGDAIKGQMFEVTLTQK